MSEEAILLPPVYDGTCAYSGRSLSPRERTWDHVFPRFMGGTDAQRVPALKKLNNNVGSLIEGALVNDFSLAWSYVRRERRQKLKFRGATTTDGSISGDFEWAGRDHLLKVKGKPVSWKDKSALVFYNINVNKDAKALFLIKAFVGMMYLYFGEASHISLAHQKLMRTLVQASDAMQFPPLDETFVTLAQFSDDHSVDQEKFKTLQRVGRRIDESFLMVSIYRRDLIVTGFSFEQCIGVLKIANYDHSPSTQPYVGNTVVFPCHMKLKGALLYTNSDVTKVLEAMAL